MPDHQAGASPDVQPPVSLSHFVHVLRAYLPVMAFTLAGIMAAYVIAAAALYTFASAQRLTTLSFRLNFEGAERGFYPNGTRFSGSEIISTPVLLRVFHADQLGQYMTYAEFTRAVFVLESNPAQEALTAEYQARLSDPRLTAVDRERIQTEFENKRASLSKNEYSINFIRRERLSRIPEPLARKVLTDILAAWARYAAAEQRVLTFDVPVLSPRVVDSTGLARSNEFVGLQVLRSVIQRAVKDVDRLQMLPSADLARTPKSRLSAPEVRLRLEEIIRYELDPLVAQVDPADRGAAVHFMSIQLAYDERRLQAFRDRANAVRDTLAVYTSGTAPRQESGVGARPSAPNRAVPPESGEMIMPQVSDTFLDRLVALTTNASDTAYRQKLASEYRDALHDVTTAEDAVAYDREVLKELADGGPSIEGEVARAQSETIRGEVRTLIGATNELYEIVSRSLNPPTHLYTTTSTPWSRVERKYGIPRLAMLGVLLFLLSLPVLVIGALLHNRVREEDAEAMLPRGSTT